MASLLNFLNMKYPDAKDINNNYDGKNHIILPVKLQKIVYYKQELFLLNYNDMSLRGKSMITLLVKENGQFYKLPLIKYDSSYNTFGISWYFFNISLKNSITSFL